MKYLFLSFIALFCYQSADACPLFEGYYMCENSEDNFDFSNEKNGEFFNYKINNDSYITDGETYTKSVGSLLRTEYKASCTETELITKRDHENLFEPGVIHTQDEVFSYSPEGNITAELKISTNGQVRGHVFRNCFKQ